MRIASLHLKAYGPFEAARLDLDSPAAGLQIVYGPNERGKSTALRAIHAMLFGFPTRTDDHFGRDYGALRVGAVLDDGLRRRALMRRKGAKHTLFEFDPGTETEYPDRMVDQAAIDAMLGGVDARRFAMMYGMGSAQLRDGGRALLDSGSELGVTLFEAASGVQRLRTVAAALQDEADALFVPRGQRPVLNATLAEVQARLEEARAAGLRPRDWQARRDALVRAEQEVSRLEASLRERRVRVARLARLLGLGPQVARLDALRREDALLAAVPLLPAESAERLAAWRVALEQSASALAEARERQRHNGASLAALEVSQAHLDAAAPIAQLAGRLEDLEATRLARVALRTAAESAGAALCRRLAAIAAGAVRSPADGAASADNAARSVDAASLVDAAPPAQAVPAEAVPAEAAARAAAWLPARAVIADARRRLGERRALDGRCADAREDLVEAERSLHEALGAFEAAGEPPDLSGFVAAVDASVAAGDLEQRISTLAGRLASTDAQLARQAAALGARSPDALARLERPGSAELEAAEAATRRLQAALGALQARREEPIRTLRELRAQRTELSAQRAIADRDALGRARDVRDAQLQVAQRDPAGPAGAQALSTLGPAIRDADRIADARFDDASRIAAIESLAHRIGQIEQALRVFDADESALQAESGALAQDWVQRLAARGLPSLDPAAYRDWAERHQRFLDALQAREALAAEHDAAVHELDRHITLLQAAYAAAGQPWPGLPGLTGVLAHARRLIEAAQHADRARARSQDALGVARRERERRRDAVDALARLLRAERPGWAQLAASLRLPTDPSPGELEARLDAFESLRDALAAWDDANARLQEAEARIGLFGRDACALARRLAVAEPAAGDESAFVAGCGVALAQAERARDTRLRLLTEATSLEIAIADALRRHDQARAGIAALQEAAGVADLPALHEVVQRSERRRRIDQEVAELDAMVRATTGAAHEALVAEAAAADAESLQAEEAELRERIADDESARDRALDERTRAMAAFEAVDGDGAAARAREAVHERLAASARLATDWARLRLARVLLDEAVQRHQQRAQGPLLAAASRWFARVTGGRWSALRPDWSGDVQVLLAERDDGSRLAIDGLSEGTADALYLALRLAAIEVRLGSAPPVPLLLDDVLMTFDDDRAALALQGLAELGQRNQVVYFTHHRHLVALATRVLPAGSVSVRELARGPLAA